MYVLYGIAGIGKTTVAQTIAEYAAGLKLLGASFFFSRTEDELKTGEHFFSTLAFQLAQHDLALASHIAAALLNTPDAWHKTLATQMEHLVINPVQQVKLPTPTIFVVDAFDECLPSDAKIILDLLARNIHSMPGVKVLLTARPESHIEIVLRAKTNLQSFFLHEIDKSVAKGDIGLYLKHSLSRDQIVQTLHFGEWEPNQDDLKFLVEKCGILFIIASTAVKYILDDYLNNPASQMSRLLDGLDVEEGELGVMTFLDRMYLNILKSSIPPRNSSGHIHNFQRVVGAIVVLEDLLPMSSLAHLLDMQESDVRTTLQNLHSIMAPVSSNQAPQLYHKSFPDFVTDNRRCIDRQFLIVPQVHHAQVAQFCFAIMDTNLHINMYNLEGMDKYMTNAEIMERNPNKEIPKELVYACMFWAAHMSKAGGTDIDTLCSLLHGFAFTHLLHWIEVLSLIGKLRAVYPILQLAQQVLGSYSEPWQSYDVEHKTSTQIQWKSKIPQIDEMLTDGYKCVTMFHGLIRTSALHVYYSALPFVPLNSLLHSIYTSITPGLPIIIRGWQNNWDSEFAAWDKHILESVSVVAFSSDCSKVASGSYQSTARLWDGVTGGVIAILDGHSGHVNIIAFSPDGSRLVSVSQNSTFKLWNGVTGDHIAIIEGHSESVNVIAFSPDGSRLASGSEDNTIKLWNGITGAHISTLEGNPEWVRNIVFSPDGSRMAFGTHDLTIKLWDGITGTYIATLEGHSDWIGTIAFSPDGSRLASGARDLTVKLWDGITGAGIATLEGHSSWVKTIAFSPDSSRVASVSKDSDAKLWNGVTGAYITTLGCYSHQVNAIAFSPNSSRLALSSDDHTIKLWDGVTGAHIDTLKSHSHWVGTIIFSPNSSRLASGSNDSTVKLWNGVTGAYIATLEGYSAWINAIAFSPDSSRLASSSDDLTVKLWDGVTGAGIATLEGHSHWVGTIVFSPDGSRLASGSCDLTVKLWDGFTGACIATLKGHSHWVNVIVFSPHGSMLASGSDNLVQLWDGVTGAYIATIENQSDVVAITRFLESNFRLHFGSAHNTVNAKSTPPLEIIQHHTTILPNRYAIHGQAIRDIVSSAPVVWLPYAFLSACDAATTHDNTFAFGMKTGKVVCLKLPLLDDSL